jgi:DNA-binding transcriptional ArsR family regulator
VKAGDIRIESDLDHVRLLKALAHPIRLELLGILSYRDISPAEFARHRGEPVSNFGYHFRHL